MTTFTTGTPVYVDGDKNTSGVIRAQDGESFWVLLNNGNHTTATRTQLSPVLALADKVTVDDSRRIFMVLAVTGDWVWVGADPQSEPFTVRANTVTVYTPT